MTKYLLLAVCLTGAFASVRAIGRVDEIRNVSVTLLPAAAPASEGDAVPVAVIRIDNNLPEYELVLDFSGPPGGEAVSEVRLQAVGGILGRGGSPPDRTPLPPGPVPGSFKWNPGIQASATIGYMVEVLVAWKAPPAAPATITVSLPAFR